MESEQGLNGSFSDYDIETYEERTTTCEEWLDNLCKFYMGIGVSFDDFWYGDYCRLKYAVEAYRARLEYDNRIAWLTGLYVYDAMSVVMANSFGKGKKQKYFEQPIEIIPHEETEAEKRAKQRKEQEKIQRHFEHMIAMQKARKKAEQAAQESKQKA